MFRTLYIISLLIVTYPVSADINGRIVRESMKNLGAAIE